MSPEEEQTTRRRSSNACIRCRRHKIKCSGKVPCDACRRRRFNCEYELEEPKVFISKRYLSELQTKLALLEAKQDSPSACLQEPTPTSHIHVENGEITNPVYSPEFVTHVAGPGGDFHYLGHSSNYSYTQRVLRLLHARCSNDPFPYGTYIPAEASGLGWDGKRATVESETDTLPSLDYAIFLLNAVKFHAGQIYHLFDETSFMPQLYHFYSDPVENMTKMDLWYIHFLILLAFGKAFVVSEVQEGKPPGSELFVRAVKLFPETTYLLGDFVTATEILCCTALYYQALDARVLAYDKIGQAVRIAIGSGMHTPMQPDQVDQELIQRCRKAWWTIVVVDRQISCLIGLPIQVRDEDITTPLPVFPDSNQRNASLTIQVGLSRALAHVVNTVYRSGSTRHLNFIGSIQDALRNVASVSEELRTHFALPAPGSVGGISPIAAHLNILYHHCIVVATRPFLYLFLEKRCKSSEDRVAVLFSKEPIRHILKIGIESAKRISAILHALKQQHLIDSFLAFELEAAFSAGTFIAISEACFPSLLKHDGPSLPAISESLQVMATKGNLPAKSRLMDLNSLTRMLGDCQDLSHDTQEEGEMELTVAADQTDIASSQSDMQGFDTGSIVLPDWLEGAEAEDLYSPSHRLETIAESLDGWDSTGWFSSLAYDT
ncbi:unnamed protein product [Clonostachys rosea f. rosea IK726]|uniref:Uncharacterized protein n=1 Tax=Clonostachys rosea f. rosea IK726 TaxID=1349383 RepID=A0ACA9U3M4_BIOOC|nr:unnamed protein product [Clonostachys rosea f. rosea IK726]